VSAIRIETHRTVDRGNDGKLIRVAKSAKCAARASYQLRGALAILGGTEISMP